MSYVVGSEVYTIAHFDSHMYLLGYLPSLARVFLTDKDLNVVSYVLSLSVMEYQTAVLRGDMEAASPLLANIPSDQKTKVARFLESQGYKELALETTTDVDHRFDLAVSLAKLDVAIQCVDAKPDDFKYRKLGDVSLELFDFERAEAAYRKANDLGLLFMLYHAMGDESKLREVALSAMTSGQSNLAFITRFQLGDVKECIDILTNSGRLPEATLFAQTYAPK